MLYTLLYMSQRTQVYLTSEQRRRLDELASREGKTLAQVIREAVNAYLVEAAPESEKALAATFGVAPDAAAPPRDEWGRG
jgi:hypothetical protein